MPSMGSVKIPPINLFIYLFIHKAYLLLLAIWVAPIPWGRTFELYR